MPRVSWRPHSSSAKRDPIMNEIQDAVARARLKARRGGTIWRRPLRDLARFGVECRGKACFLHVTGDVDISNSSRLEAAIVDASRAHRGVVVVSFAACGFADCSCLSILVRQFGALAARLAIVAPPASPLRSLLDITNLSATLPVYDGLCQAELAIASGHRAALGDRPMWVSSEALRACASISDARAKRSPGFTRSNPIRHFPAGRRAVVERIGRTIV